jgi:Leucine-rich repeat (LRR) protein
MPVEVAPIEELAPIFQLLSSGVTDSEEYRKVSFQKVDGIQAERGVMFGDGRLDLCKQVVSHKHIDKLCEAVGTGAVPVRHFLLGNNIACTDVAGAKSLAGLVSKNLPIETFYLAGNSISAEGLSHIADAMESLGDTSNVRAFWFKRNPIKPEGGVHAARIVASSRNVRVLDLDNCGLLDGGFENMMSRLLNTNPIAKPLQYGLRHLYLDANGISGDSLGWALFCVNLEVLPNLKTLYLSMNDLRDVGVNGLADNLHKLSNLRVLCLSSNGITDEPIPKLVDKLGQLTKFRALDLGCYKSTRDLGCRLNVLTERSLPILADWIERNPAVQYLSLARNSITDLNTLLDFLAQLRSRAVVAGGRKLSVDAKQAAWPQHHRLVSHTKEERSLVLHTRRVQDITSIFRNKM